jgi:transcriptional regulator with XRE-family HTH domain
VVEIRKATRRLGLTQQEAAKRMGITQPKVSDMMRGDFSNLSERKLMDCLNRLGYDIEIKIKPAANMRAFGADCLVATSDRPHGLKYRLGRANGKTLARHDESWKGDHKHVGRTEALCLARHERTGEDFVNDGGQ